MGGVYTPTTPRRSVRARGRLETALLKVDRQLGHARPAPASPNHLDAVDELDVDAQGIAQVLADQGRDLVQRVVRVAAALDHAEVDRARLVLHDLEALDGE